MAGRGGLEIRNLSKQFRVNGVALPVLDDITLTVEPGEFVTLVGTSGCGKSTLLRLVAGLESDEQGAIRFDGAPVTGTGLERGIVFQEPRLFPWLTVERNIASALLNSRLSASQRGARVQDHIELVGLKGFEQAHPHQLSGGMAQRVAIARALVNRPRFLLLDEPLGALDALTRLRLQGELARIVRHQRSTALLVTHDVDEAVFLADRILVMHPHPGRVAAVLDIEPGLRRDRSAPAFLAIRDRVLALLGVTRDGDDADDAPGSTAFRHAAPALASPGV
jgi:ABC-type nitrate/sulfonate/bicarbonate transport system ATPase subunit